MERDSAGITRQKSSKKLNVEREGGHVIARRKKATKGHVQK